MFSFNFTVAGEEEAAAIVKDASPPSSTATTSIIFLDGDPDAAPPSADEAHTLRVAESLLRVSAPHDDVSGTPGLDVVRNCYEGGAKLWECTNDVLEWMRGASGREALPDARVLDLGCGTGMLGVAALQGGASRVIFQDLNEPVLARVTLPNVALNLGGEGFARCCAVAATWGDLAAAAAAEAGPAGEEGATPASTSAAAAADLAAHGAAWLHGGVDVILASEVLYNVEQYENLVSLLASTLKSPGGRAIIGTKRHYFGVGGGTVGFSAAAAARGLRVETLSSTTDGKSNVRDVLVVTRGLD